jgi:hypothetical protein
VVGGDGTEVEREMVLGIVLRTEWDGMGWVGMI